MKQLLDAMLSKTAIKIFMVLFLLILWIGLTVAKMVYPTLEVVPIITLVQAALAGLGVSHLQDIIDGVGKPVDTPPPSADKDPS
jgi:hypothetical protein